MIAVINIVIFNRIEIYFINHVVNVHKLLLVVSVIITIIFSDHMKINWIKGESLLVRSALCGPNHARKMFFAHIHVLGLMGQSTNRAF